MAKIESFLSFRLLHSSEFARLKRLSSLTLPSFPWCVRSVRTVIRSWQSMAAALRSLLPQAAKAKRMPRIHPKEKKMCIGLGSRYVTTISKVPRIHGFLSYGRYEIPVAQTTWIDKWSCFFFLFCLMTEIQLAEHGKCIGIGRLHR